MTALTRIPEDSLVRAASLLFSSGREERYDATRYREDVLGRS